MALRHFRIWHISSMSGNACDGGSQTWSRRWADVTQTGAVDPKPTSPQFRMICTEDSRRLIAPN